MLAEREIDKDEYLAWSEKYRKVRLLSEGSEQEIERL